MDTAILLFNQYDIQRGFAGGSVVKNPPAMQETQEERVHSQFKDSIQVSCIVGGFFNIWATRENPVCVYSMALVGLLNLKWAEPMSSRWLN